MSNYFVLEKGNFYNYDKIILFTLIIVYCYSIMYFLIMFVLH